jgi:uncharacterized protein
MDCRRFLLAAMVAIIAVIADGYSCETSAEVAVPRLTGRVVDLTGTLTNDAIVSLSRTLRDFEARRGNQIAVLFVPTTQPETIEQYSLRVANDWKIGRNKINDGVVIVVAVDDHKLRIEVGYGLESVLSNSTAKRIIDENIVPHFRFGDFAGGISAGVIRIIGVIDNEELLPPTAAKPIPWDFNTKP